MSQRHIKASRISVKSDPRRKSLTSKHRRIAHALVDQGQFEHYLSQLRPEVRKSAREILTPYLNFTIAVAQETA